MQNHFFIRVLCYCENCLLEYSKLLGISEIQLLKKMWFVIAFRERRLRTFDLQWRKPLPAGRVYPSGKFSRTMRRRTLRLSVGPDGALIQIVKYWNDLKMSCDRKLQFRTLNWIEMISTYNWTDEVIVISICFKWIILIIKILMLSFMKINNKIAWQISKLI